MFTQDSNYGFAILAALAVAVVVTFLALVRAYSGALFLA
jgi:Tfp pilus assembly protein PilX